jgi:hypothetical protein
LGFSVNGNVAPVTENPAPETVAEFTVTEAVPVDVRVTGCVAGVSSTTLPKARLVVLMLKVEVPPAFNCRPKVLVRPPALAESVTVWSAVNAETAALKVALVAFAGTVTLTGTATNELLLDRVTVSPLLPAGAARPTVQASVPAADIDPLTHVRALNVPGAAIPAPLIFTTTFPLDELLTMVSVPVKELRWSGLNWRFNVVFCPGLRVTGAITPEEANNEPATEIDEIVTALVPAEVRVTDCLAVCPTITLPKLMLEVLALSVGVPAFNCNAKDFVAPPAAAVRVAA